ncbi:MAG: hypothetical protein AB7K09_02570 [Planctomycetota bacterium]
MTRDQFLTVRWNNILSLGLGVPTLAFVIVVLSTSLLSDAAAFTGMAIAGAVY